MPPTNTRGCSITPFGELRPRGTSPVCSTFGEGRLHDIVTLFIISIDHSTRQVACHCTVSSFHFIVSPPTPPSSTQRENYPSPFGASVTSLPLYQFTMRLRVRFRYTHSLSRLISSYVLPLIICPPSHHMSSLSSYVLHLIIVPPPHHMSSPSLPLPPLPSRMDRIVWTPPPSSLVP